MKKLDEINLELSLKEIKSLWHDCYNEDLETEYQIFYDSLKQIQIKYIEKRKERFKKLFPNYDNPFEKIKINEDEDNSEYWKHYDDRNKMNNDETYKD